MPSDLMILGWVALIALVRSAAVHQFSETVAAAEAIKAAAACFHGLQSLNVVKETYLF